MGHRLNNRADSVTRSLVALTTCARPSLIAKNLMCLKTCLKKLPGFELVVVIDGLSVAGNMETMSIALGIGVDCIVADEAEGVGIAKNRVMSLFGDYDYYFFIEDDVEVLSPDLFTGHIEVYLQTGIHHFSLHEPARLQYEGTPTRLAGGEIIRHARFGSAQVNFFTRKALAKVGGWHRQFGELRRGGHTEHSYRVYNAGLSLAPFNYINKLIDTCCWHNPSSIVSVTGHKIATNRLFSIENELISQKLGWQPWYAKHPGRVCLAADFANETLKVRGI